MTPAPDIERSRCTACGWRRNPIHHHGQHIGWTCPNCQSHEETA